MRVDTAAGAYCVIWHHPQCYIETRKDIRTPNHSHIELVRNGHVTFRTTQPNQNAPALLVQLMRELK